MSAKRIEIEGWLPIATAESSAAADWERANREQKPVLVCHVQSGRVRAGVVRDFFADDGTLRKGIGAGLGIFMATHWQPLHGLTDA